MKRFRDVFIGVLIGCMLMATPVLADSILTKIDVVLNGINVQVDGEDVQVESILYNGSTYLPMRKVAELVGKDVNWTQETKTANIIEKTEIKEGEDGMSNETSNENEFVVYNIDDDPNCYAEKGGITYYHLRNIVRLMNEEGKNGIYGFDISKLSNNNVRLYDGDSNTVVETVPYEMIRDRIFISKKYYETTILPLIK